MSDTLLLSLIVFLPSAGALLLLFVPGRMEREIKAISLVATIATFLLSVLLLRNYLTDPEPSDDLRVRAARALSLKAAEQPDDPKDLVFRYDWIGSASSRGFHVEYYMGVDGISLPLVLLTGLIGMLGMVASWGIAKQIKGYCILYLLLVTGMMGTFLALDFFLFYVFWEIMLLPMYFLIGIWGAPSRVEADGRVRGGPYAAIKFFIYTLVGSVLLLVAMLAYYFHEVPGPTGVGDMVTARSFDLMQMHTWAMKNRGVYGLAFQITMFVLLYIGFAIKVPVFPFHTWLPDAHVEAPTPISMILAGVLLKMGGYGFVRIAYPLAPAAAAYLAWPLVFIGVFNIIYGAFAAMAQTDFKKLVAYSSISHMGYVILGLAVWSTGSDFDPNIWAMGMNGAMFQMIAHGISSAGMFLMVGVVYDRFHHRDLNRFGGLATTMPVYSGLAAGIFFAGLGLPGLCGFIGEVMTVLSSWQFSRTMAVIAAAGVILTAGYILWTLQRVLFGLAPSQLAHGAGHGHDDHGHGSRHEHESSDITFREMLCAVPLLALAILLGVYPNALLNFMAPSVTNLVLDLSNTARELTVGLSPLTR